MDVYIVHTSVEKKKDAQRLAKAVLEQRLAACVQMAPVQSQYWWQGAITQATEYALSFKTSETRLNALMTYIRRNHPYERPELVATECKVADNFYAAWVDEVTGDDHGV